MQVAKNLRHVVLFAFSADAPASEIQRVCDHFARLPGEIDLIRAFEWGVDVSPEGIARGYTHCFLVTFASEADRDAYLVHAAHRAFVVAATPFLGSALVVDYWCEA